MDFTGGKGIAVTFGCLAGLVPALEAFWVLVFFFIGFSTVLQISPHFYRTIFCICIFSRDHVQRDKQSGCSLGIFPHHCRCINTYAYQQRGTKMSGGETAWMLSYSHVGQEADITLRRLRSCRRTHTPRPPGGDAQPLHAAQQTVWLKRSTALYIKAGSKSAELHLERLTAQESYTDGCLFDSPVYFANYGMVSSHGGVPEPESL